MAVRLGQYEFRPALAPTLFVMVGFPLLVGLGLWQLDRAGQKETVIANHARQIERAAIRLDSIEGDVVAFEYRNVMASGRYDLEHQYLLDNRTHQGRAGYHVFTPLLLTDGRAVLVNRGWVPQGRTRADLPELPAPDGDVKILARISSPPEAFRLGADEEPVRTGTRVIQQVDLDVMQARLGVTLLSAVLLLDRDDAHGFVRDWKPVYGIGPDKHRAYAFQWFSIALILLVVYIAISSRRLGADATDPQ